MNVATTHNSIFKRFTPRAEDKQFFFPLAYKGYTILCAVGNVPEPHVDNVFIVQNEQEDTSFIVGLDDSKSCGYRKSVPNSLEDALGYIDWLTRDKQ